MREENSMSIVKRLARALKDAHVVDGQKQPYSEERIKAILSSDNMDAVQENLAPILRRLAVNHLETSQQPRAKNFRKVCDFYVLSDGEAKDLFAKANNDPSFPNSYILNKETGSLSVILRNNNPRIQTFALNESQIKQLESGLANNNQANPISFTEIDQMSNQIGQIKCTNAAIVSPNQTEFLVGDMTSLPLPKEKTLTETKSNSPITLKAWYQNERKNGAWGSDDSAGAIAEALGCGLSIERKQDRVNSEFDSEDKNSPTLQIKHNGSDHWESKGHVKTLGDGNCLFNAIGQQIHLKFQQEQKLSLDRSANPSKNVPSTKTENVILESIPPNREISDNEVLMIKTSLQKLKNDTFDDGKIKDYELALIGLFKEKKSGTLSDTLNNVKANSVEKDEALAKQLQMEEIESLFNNKP